MPDSTELSYAIQYNASLLQQSITSKLNDLRQRINSVTTRYSFRKPQDLIELQRIRADQLTARLSSCMRQELMNAKSQLSLASGKLNALSPLATLSRGYSITYGSNHQPVAKVSQVQIDEQITVLLQDGKLGCVIRSKEGTHE